MSSKACHQNPWSWSTNDWSKMLLSQLSKDTKMSKRTIQKIEMKLFPSISLLCELKDIFSFLRQYDWPRWSQNWKCFVFACIELPCFYVVLLQKQLQIFVPRGYLWKGKEGWQIEVTLMTTKKKRIVIKHWISEPFWNRLIVLFTKEFLW